MPENSITRTEAVLEVENLSKEFGDLRAVDDVSFTLMSGGSLAIVGESGSGKTTVARMIAGLETPSSGAITCCNRDRSRPARSTKERRRRGREAQMVFQDPYTSLDRRQTIAGALDEVLRLHDRGTRADRGARIAELGDLVGLDDRQLGALPRSLSGGQRQRAAIARALAASPRLLILDESVSALDVSIQAQVLNVLSDIRAQTGLPYLLISHDLAVVRQLTEDVIVMHRGRIVERGPTPQVLDDPKDPYTQILRESVPGPGWKPSRRVRISMEVADTLLSSSERVPTHEGTGYLTGLLGRLTRRRITQSVELKG
jgi:oligopeptide transport system ATP-binding protein